LRPVSSLGDVIVFPGNSGFYLGVGCPVGTEIKQFVQPVFRECLFGTDKEFFIDTALPHPDTVYLTDRQLHGSGEVGQVMILAISEFEDSGLNYHSIFSMVTSVHIIDKILPFVKYFSLFIYLTVVN
jgi:hypothetical protein